MLVTGCRLFVYLVLTQLDKVSINVGNPPEHSKSLVMLYPCISYVTQICIITIIIIIIVVVIVIVVVINNKNKNNNNNNNFPICYHPTPYNRK